MRKSSIRKHFVENQPVTALIDSGCQIPVLNSSLIRVQTPSEEIITLSSCFGEQRMVEVKPINISLNQQSPSLSVRTAISPTLTEEFIIHPSVYSEIKKLGHAKESDVLLNEMNIIGLCCSEGSSSPGSGNEGKKRNRFEQTSRTLQRKISMRSTKDQLVEKDVLMPVKHNVFLWNLPIFSSGLHGNTAADSVLGSGWPLWHAAKSKTKQSSRRRIKVKAELKLKKAETLEKKLNIRAERKREKRTREVREQALPSEYHRQSYL
ncbi:hypothetical protein TNCV_2255971 [Trichonephila clavipes]|nr:hypothetical protein TNCV_2255971 [Trichonephila clavipes]